ncbi:TrkH family potassium uptake protein [Halorhabdus sp. BNX81]|uniref:TrkH family potassium uptake protein n=1 Tax=Halorhabdus sp. BNX81 TaxID=2980181 RepID=UPI0023DD205E|nr:TrkH family potassium uptake protein [Halorhabdus sp. BNX81]WEL20466.1 Trk-type K+ transport system, membrane component [Halorhabdus sp. BNX81]
MNGHLRVDWRASLSLTGRVLLYLAVPLLLPLVTALLYGEGWMPFLATIVVTTLLGYGLSQLDDDRDIGAREGFLMVASTWLAVALVGTLPYLLAEHGTASTLSWPHVPNALFESMSGFTTTGATVMKNIGVEHHSHALLIWRQLTQWLGGMGIVVLAVAILPELSVGGAQLMDAEAPGPGIEKLTPRIAETARVLWIAYFAFTVLEMALLYGLHLAGFAKEMTLFNAISHGLTTLPTGGFSPEAYSIEVFSAAVQWAIIPFMVVAGTNFALFWGLVRGDPRSLLADEEFRFYTGAMASLTAVVTVVLFVGSSLPGTVGLAGVEQSLRHGLFQVVSIVTTTGYASFDFNGWSMTAQYLLLFGMFLGGSAGSTGGAIKMVRWLVIAKSIKRELFTTVHPEAVKPVRLGGRALDESAIRGIHAFTLLYIALFFLSVVVLMLDAGRIGMELQVLDGMSAIAATIGNVGPGFGAVGPMENYLSFPWTSKFLMVFLMWIGRLEIFPVLVLLTRAYWRS